MAFAGIILQLAMIMQKCLVQIVVSPITIGTQVALPVALVAVVTIVRQTSPPVVKPACNFQSYSMPSDGSLVFMQSMTCRSNMKCYKANESPPQSQNAAFQKFENLQTKLSKITNNKKKMKSMKSMPSMVISIVKIAKTLEKPEVKAMIDSKLTLGSFFKNQSRIIDFLVNDQNLLPRQIATDLFDATLNISVFLNKDGIQNPKAVVCNSSTLQKYVEFPRKSIADLVSKKLCSMNSSKIGNLVKEIQAEFDFGKVIRVLSNYSAVLGDFKVSTALRDIALLMDMSSKFTVFSNLDQKTVMFITNWMGTAMRDLANLFDKNPVLQQMQGLVFGFSKMDAFMRFFAGNTTNTWNTMLGWMSQFNNIVQMAKSTLTNLKAKKITFGNVIPQPQSFFGFLNSTGLRITKAFNTMMNSELNLENYLSAVEKLVTGTQTKSIFCEDPGFINLVKVDSETKKDLQAMQMKLCLFNDTVFLKEMEGILNISKIGEMISTSMSGPSNSIDWNKLIQSVYGLPKDMEQIVMGISSFFSLLENQMKLSSNGNNSQILTDMENLEKISKTVANVLRKIDNFHLDRETLRSLQIQKATYSFLNQRLEKIQNGTNPVMAFISQPDVQKLLNLLLTSLPDLKAAGSLVTRGWSDVHHIINSIQENQLCTNVTLLDFIPEPLKKRPSLIELSNFICQFNTKLPKIKAELEEEYKPIIHQYMNHSSDNISVAVIGELFAESFKNQRLMQSVFANFSLSPYDKLFDFKIYLDLIMGTNLTILYSKPSDLAYVLDLVDTAAKENLYWQTMRRQIKIQGLITQTLNKKMMEIRKGAGLTRTLLPSVHITSLLNAFIKAMPNLIDAITALSNDTKTLGSNAKRMTEGEIICKNFTLIQIVPTQFQRQRELLELSRQICSLEQNFPTVQHNVTSLYMPLIQLLTNQSAKIDISWKEVIEATSSMNANFQFTDFETIIKGDPIAILVNTTEQEKLMQHFGKMSAQIAKLISAEYSTAKVLGTVMDGVQSGMKSNEVLDAMKSSFANQIKWMRLYPNMIERLSNGTSILTSILPNKEMQQMIIPPFIEALPDLLESHALLLADMTPVVESKLLSPGKLCVNYTILDVLPKATRSRSSIVNLNTKLCQLMEKFPAIKEQVLKLVDFNMTSTNESWSALIKEYEFLYRKSLNVGNIIANLNSTFFVDLLGYAKPTYQQKFNEAMVQFQQILLNAKTSTQIQSYLQLMATIIDNMNMTNNPTLMGIKDNLQKQVNVAKFISEIMGKIRNGSGVVEALLPTVQIQNLFKALSNAMPDIIEIQADHLYNLTLLQSQLGHLASGGIPCVNYTLLELFAQSHSARPTLLKLHEALCGLMSNIPTLGNDLMRIYDPIVKMFGPPITPLPSLTAIITEHATYMEKISEQFNISVSTYLLRPFDIIMSPSFQQKLAVASKKMETSFSNSMFKIQNETQATLFQIGNLITKVLTVMENPLKNDRIWKEAKGNFETQVKVYEFIGNLMNLFLNGTNVFETMFPISEVQNLLNAAITAVPDILEAQISLAKNASALGSLVETLMNNPIPCVNLTLLDLVPESFRTKASLVNLNEKMCALARKGDMISELMAVYGPLIQSNVNSSRSWSELYISYTTNLNRMPYLIGMVNATVLQNAMNALVSQTIQLQVMQAMQKMRTELSSNNTIQYLYSNIKPMSVMFASVDAKLATDHTWVLQRESTFNQAAYYKVIMTIMDQIKNGSGLAEALVPNAQIQTLMKAFATALPDILEAQAAQTNNLTALQSQMFLLTSGGLPCVNFTLLELFLPSYQNRTSIVKLHEALCGLMGRLQEVGADLMKIYQPLIDMYLQTHNNRTRSSSEWEDSLKSIIRYSMESSSLFSVPFNISMTKPFQDLITLSPLGQRMQAAVFEIFQINNFNNVTITTLTERIQDSFLKGLAVIDTSMRNNSVWLSVTKSFSGQVRAIKFLAEMIEKLHNGTNAVEIVLPITEIRNFVNSAVQAIPDLIQAHLALLTNASTLEGFLAKSLNNPMPCFNLTLLDALPTNFRSISSLIELNTNLCALMAKIPTLSPTLMTLFEPLIKANDGPVRPWSELWTEYRYNYDKIMNLTTNFPTTTLQTAVLNLMSQEVQQRLNQSLANAMMRLSQLSGNDTMIIAETYIGTVSQLMTTMEAALSEDVTWQGYRKFVQLQVNILSFFSAKFAAIENGSSAVETLLPNVQVQELLNQLVVAFPDLLAAQAAIMNDSSATAEFNRVIASGLPCLNYTLLSLFPAEFRTRSQLLMLQMKFCMLMINITQVQSELLAEYSPVIQSFTNFMTNTTVPTTPWKELLTRYFGEFKKIQTSLTPTPSGTKLMNILKPFHLFLSPTMMQEIITKWSVIENATINKWKNSPTTSNHTESINGLAQIYTTLDVIMSGNQMYLKFRENVVMQYKLYKFMNEKLDNIKNGSSILQETDSSGQIKILVEKSIAALPDLIELHIAVINDSTLLNDMLKQTASGLIPCVNVSLLSLIPAAMRNRSSLVQLSRQICVFYENSSTVFQTFLVEYMGLITVSPLETTTTSWQIMLTEFERYFKNINSFGNFSSYPLLLTPFLEVLNAKSNAEKLVSVVTNLANPADQTVKGLSQAFTVVDTVYSTSPEWRVFKAYINATSKVIQLINARVSNWLANGQVHLAITETVQLQQLIVTSIEALPVIVNNMTRSKLASFTDDIAGRLNGGQNICGNFTLAELLPNNAKITAFSNAICAFKVSMPQIMTEYVSIVQNFLLAINSTSAEVDLIAIMGNVMSLKTSIETAMSNITGVLRPFTDLAKPDVVNQLMAFYTTLTNTSTMQPSELTTNIQTIVKYLQTTGNRDFDTAIGFINDLQNIVMNIWNTMEQSNFTITQYFKPTEIAKLFTFIDKHPVVLRTLVETAVDLMKNPIKMNQWTQQASSLCTDTAVFNSLVSVPSGSTHAQIQQLLCGVAGMNTTLLMTQMQGLVPGLIQLIMRIQAVQRNVTMPNDNFNATEIFLKFKGISDKFDINKFQLGINMSNFNEPVIMALLGPSLKKLQDSALPNTDIHSNLRTYQTRLLPLLDLLRNSTPEAKVIIDRTLSGLNTLTSIVIGGYKNLESEMNTTADGKMLLYLVNNFPLFVKKLLEMESRQPRMISALIEEITKLGILNQTQVLQTNPLEYFCRKLNISVLLKESPSDHFKISDFWDKLCVVNITRGMPSSFAQLIQILTPSMTTRTLSTSEISNIFTNVLSAVKQVEGAFNATNSSLTTWNHLFSLFNAFNINFAFNETNAIILQAKTLDNLFKLLNGSADVEFISKYLKTQNLILDVINSELNALKGRNLTIKFILRNTTHLMQFLQSFKSIDVNQVLKTPINVTQILSWIQSGNFYSQLCSEGSGRIFINPTFNVTSLTNALCIPGTPSALNEVKNMFQIQNIISTASKSVLEKAGSFLEFYQNISQLMQLLGGTRVSLDNIFNDLNQLFSKLTSINVMEIIQTLSTSKGWWSNVIDSVSAGISFANVTTDANFQLAKLMLMFQTTVVKGSLSLINGSAGSAKSLEIPVSVGIKVIDEIINKTLQMTSSTSPTNLAFMINQLKPLLSSTWLLSETINNGTATRALSNLNTRLTGEESKVVVKLIYDLIGKYLPYLPQNTPLRSIIGTMTNSSAVTMNAIAAVIGNGGEAPSASKLAATILDVIGRHLINHNVAVNSTSTESTLLLAFGKLFLNTSEMAKLSSASPLSISDSLIDFLSYINKLSPFLEPVNRAMSVQLMMMSFSFLKNIAGNNDTLRLSSIIPLHVMDDVLAKSFMYEMELFSKQPQQLVNLMTSINVTATLCDKSEFDKAFDTNLLKNATQSQLILCEGSRNKTLVIDKILKHYKVDQLMKLIGSSFDASFLKKLSASLISVVGNLQKMNTAPKIDLISNLPKILQNLVNSISIGNLSALIQNTKQPIESTCYVATGMLSWWFPQLKVQPMERYKIETVKGDIASMVKDLPDTICYMSNMEIGKALTKITKHLNKTLVEIKLSQNGIPACKELSSSIYNILHTTTEVYTALSKPTYFNRMSTCLNALPAAVSKIGKGMTELHAFLKNVSVIQQLPKEVLPFIDLLVSSVSANDKVWMNISKILQATENSKDLIKQLADSAGQTVQSISNMTLIVKVDDLVKMKKSELRSVLCNATQMNQYIQTSTDIKLPVTTLSNVLCNLTDQQLTQFLSTLKITQIINSIQKPLGFSTESVAFIMNSTFAIINELQKFTSFIDLFKAVTFENLSESLFRLEEMFNQFIKRTPFDEIVSKATAIVSHLGKQFNSTVVTSLITDFQRVANGAKAFKTLQKFFPIQFEIKQFFDNQDRIKNFLIQNANLSSSDATWLFNSKLSSYEILKIANTIDLPGIFCNETRLNKVLSWDANATRNSTIKDISNALCKKNNSVNIELVVETLIKNASIANFIQMSLGMQMAKSFKEQGINVNEMKTTLSDVQELMGSMESLPTADLDVIEGINAEQTGDNSVLTTIDKVLCGNTNSTSTMSSGISASSFVGRRRRKRSTKTKEEIFCDQMVASIGKSTTGKVMMHILKPLMKGPIIITPDTPAIRTLMTKVNATFQQIEDLRVLGNSMSTSLDSLGQNSSILSSLQNAMKNPLIANLLASSFGTSDLSSVISNFQSVMNSSSTKVMKYYGELISNFTSCIVRNRMHFYPSESDEAYIKMIKEESKLSVLAAINFHNVTDRNSTILPKHVKYTVRMSSFLSVDTNNIYFLPFPRAISSFLKLHYMHGFQQLQELIERGIIEMHSGKNASDLPKVKLQQFPNHCNKRDSFIQSVGNHIIPLMIVMSFLSPFLMTVSDAVEERELHLEKLLFLMGRNDKLHWFMWFLKATFNFLILNIILTLSLSVGKMLSEVNAWFIFVALLDFGFALTMFGYFFSVFFNRSSNLLLVTVMVYFLAYIPFTFSHSQFVKMPKLFFDVSMILPVIPMNFLTYYWSIYQVSSISFDWNHLQTHDLLYSPQWCLLAMFFDGVGYFLIGWFFHNVLGGRRGMRHPIYFFLTPRYWGYASKARKRQEISHRNLYDPSTSTSSSDTSKSAVSVSLQNVSKHYGLKKRPVVKNLSLDLRRHEVTVLLGPNGAGKSTTMSMLNGILQPDSGSITIEGFDRQKNFNALRKIVGICTQRESFFPDMTVMQNLEYFAAFRSNYSSKERKIELQNLMHQLRLDHFKDVRAKNLSGGKQRCLSIAIAFVGDPSFIILDEPTSGVDPSARRIIWDLISSRKMDRTILLCTHHMDEAEIVGDRVAILRNGELVAHDTPSALREQFGCKYLVSMNFNDTANQSDKEEVVQMAKKQIDTCEVDDFNDEEVNMSVKITRNTEFLMPSLLQCLESSMENGILRTIGLTFLALETAFMKVINGPDIKEEREIVEEANFEPVEIRKQSTNLRFFTIIHKQILHTLRDWITYIVTILTPCIMLLLVLGSTYIIPTVFNYKRVLLSPSIYGPDAKSFLKMPLNKTASDTTMMDSLFNLPGLGTICMKETPPPYPVSCVAKNVSIVSPHLSSQEINAYLSAAKCTCTVNGRLTCPNKYSLGWPTTVVRSPTSDQIVILNKHQTSVSEYLQTVGVNKTDHRALLWGGWEFGLSNNTIRVWYNTKGYHTGPSYFNALSNMILRDEVMQKTNNQTEVSEYGITVYNHPFPNANISSNLNDILTKMMDIGVGFGLLIGVTAIPCSLMLRTLQETNSREKFLQLLYGVNPNVYWIAHFVWDLFCGLIVMGLFALIIFAFKVPSFYDRQNFLASLVNLYLYVFAVLPLSYISCRGFQRGSKAFIVIFVTLVFSAFFLSAFLLLLRLIGGGFSSDTKTSTQIAILNAANIMDYVFMTIPSYSCISSFMKMTENQMITSILEPLGIPSYKNPFGFNMIGWNLIFLGAEGVLFFLINLCFETAIFKKTVNRLRCPSCSKKTESSIKYTQREGEISREDQSVFEEKRRISQLTNEPLIISHLYKTYHKSGSKIKAVSDVSFGIERGQCFGLLGTNGAGKTSLFKCITGELTGDDGKARLLGKQVGTQVHQLNASVGYCPQTNPLDMMLTLEETLQFYGRLCGVAEPSRTQWIKQLMHVLDIYCYRNKKVKHLSGGNQRKLSFAIAVVGQPELLLLDEPSSGVDVISKRRIWRVLSSIRHRTSILLTSHSMEEMQMVANRLAIMVNGKLRAIGTCPELKSNFGSSYTIQIWSSPVSAETISHRLSLEFPGCQLKSRKANMSEYTVPMNSVTLSQIFSSLEQLKKIALGVREFAVQHTTLEQIFLQLAEVQHDGVDKPYVSSSYDSFRSSNRTPSSLPEYTFNKGYVNEEDEEIRL